MTKEEMVKRSRQALAEFDKLPPDVQKQELIAHGTINEKGEVLLGRDDGQKQEPPKPKR